MILSFMDEILRSNPDNLKKLSITGIDLDRICVKMTTLQIMANLLIHQRQLGEICILHGNSLLPLTTIPVFYHAFSPELMQAEAELRKKEKEEKTVSTPPAEPAQIIQPKGQMSLFDLQI
jgi:hypothetical protein